MDRDSFPTLTESSRGWPELTVRWGQGRSVSVEVFEDDDEGDAAIVYVSAPGIRVGVINMSLTGCNYEMCRCCNYEILPFVGGSMPQHKLCDDCGRGKCSNCINEVRELYKYNK